MRQEGIVREVIEKIARECEEAGATKWDVIRIVKEISKNDSATEGELRRSAVELLKNLNPKAAEVYASFERMHVLTSRETVEPFDRGNIIKSLLRETKIPRGLAEKIGSEVEEELKDLKVKNLTTSLIREMVNVKLLRYGFEDIHNQYFRVGMPVFDVSQRINEGLFENREVLRGYNLLSVIPQRLSAMHFSGKLSIHAVEDFSTRPFAFSFPQGELRVAHVNEFFLKAAEMQGFFSAPLSIDALNYRLCSAVNCCAMQRVEALAMEVLFGLKALSLAKGRVTAVLNLFPPEEFERVAVERKKMNSFNNSLLRLWRENNSPFELAFNADSRFALKSVEEKNAGSGLKIINSSRKYHRLFHKGIAVEGFEGVRGFYSINLERIAAGNKGAEGELTEGAIEAAKAIKGLEELRVKELGSREYLKGFALEGFCPVVELKGLGVHAEAKRLLKEVSAELGNGFKLVSWDAAAAELFSRARVSTLGGAGKAMEKGVELVELI